MSDVRKMAAIWRRIGDPEPTKNKIDLWPELWLAAAVNVSKRPSRKKHSPTRPGSSVRDLFLWGFKTWPFQGLEFYDGRSWKFCKFAPSNLLLEPWLSASVPWDPVWTARIVRIAAMSMIGIAALDPCQQAWMTNGWIVRSFYQPVSFAARISGVVLGFLDNLEIEGTVYAGRQSVWNTLKY